MLFEPSSSPKRRSGSGGLVLVTLRCVTCDRPLGDYRLRESLDVIVRCRHCRTLQHRRLGRLPERQIRR
jgi:hypothetical protein